MGFGVETTDHMRYDVAIVGASISGCAAAILFGRKGARLDALRADFLVGGGVLGAFVERHLGASQISRLGAPNTNIGP